MIRVNGITKAFPGVKALDGVSLSIRPGEVHALLGENGSGKSTLTKIISGLYQPNEGELFWEDKPVRWSKPRDAADAGIHVVYQELVMFGDLTVAENIFIGRQPVNRFGMIDYAQMQRRSAEALKQLGTDIDVHMRVKDLSVAKQQMVEIAKALVGTVKVLILDEPTAVIAGQEVEKLFNQVLALCARGVSIIYISHRLEEIFRIADRVTVLKDGKHVRTCDIKEIDRQQLVALMVGRELKDYFPPREPALAGAAVRLEAEDIHVGQRVRGASLSLRSGEIVGLAGMVGSGRTELAMAIFGGLPMDAGTVTVDGAVVPKPSPLNSIRAGVGMLTEDRKAEGLFLHLDIAQNISAPALETVSRGPVIDLSLEIEVAQEQIAKFKVAAPGPHTGVRGLSGGNQQKVLFGRWVRVADKVLILDEPTRGVDVGAKAEIYRIVRALAKSGVAILMISSELPEIIGMSDRVLVMRDGEIRGELIGDAVTEESIMTLATHH
jgi:ABC-type sugar transport system ATPase subunit